MTALLDEHNERADDDGMRGRSVTPSTFVRSNTRAGVDATDTTWDLVQMHREELHNAAGLSDGPDLVEMGRAQCHLVSATGGDTTASSAALSAPSAPSSLFDILAFDFVPSFAFAHSVQGASHDGMLRSTFSDVRMAGAVRSLVSQWYTRPGAEDVLSTAVAMECVVDRGGDGGGGSGDKEEEGLAVLRRALRGISSSSSNNSSNNDDDTSSSIRIKTVLLVGDTPCSRSYVSAVQRLVASLVYDTRNGHPHSVEVEDACSSAPITITTAAAIPATITTTTGRRGRGLDGDRGEPTPRGGTSTMLIAAARQHVAAEAAVYVGARSSSFSALVLLARDRRGAERSGFWLYE